ncbi:hypothetical protein SPRG_09943 [Saprolegnia parasitica CBS 223.65]|uniref:Uncharacterized protein n=1 Tax=Saprolegnia parasitica (strain CBS 223.65) TaxID=695850 RepID=A0A067C1Z0_SAPPC|nr:hypothetical protein SPRG_09943 [Saprolegnia parasitica CBS 223.65]KDO23135.1 hypothetical protein SPRG_09943 [Saprolegnia parasitica CBS 223.65]|eukprot:XP_012206087.1 hypothetical protein SPRG_09943 [Saprolegnia parasitica CBS 223.65]
MTNGSCFWLQASAPAAWPSCGYSWLVSAPVSLLWGVWLVYGLGRLRQATRVTNGFQFDTDKIHDPLAQGMAVALSQRKSTSIHKPKFQRYMKLGAMWAEWPSLTYTPLTIAFKVRGSSSFLSSMLVSFNSPYEVEFDIRC